jgi:hypothetical protein
MASGMHDEEVTAVVFTLANGAAETNVFEQNAGFER